MMTATGTMTAAFTITNARYVGAKIGADLRLLNGLYGRPSLTGIDDYAEEAALLLRDGYLRTVDYGFWDATTSSWKLRLRYTATTGGHLLNDRPGKLPTEAAVTGHSFYSYLTYTAAYHVLTPGQQAAVRGALPIQRVGASEPVTGLGSTRSGHGYSRKGLTCSLMKTLPKSRATTARIAHRSMGSRVPRSTGALLRPSRSRTSADSARARRASAAMSSPRSG
jgi:hypothetical protein